MGSQLVVVPPELFNLEPRVGDVEKPVRRQTLVAEPAMKALDVRVLDGLARADEHELDAVAVRPDVQRAGDELRTIVHHNASGKAAVCGELLERRDDSRRRQRGVDVDARTLARELVDHRETAKASATDAGIVDEIHAPAFIRRARRRQWRGRCG